MSDVKVSLTVALQGRTMLSQETADALEKLSPAGGYDRTSIEVSGPDHKDREVYIVVSRKSQQTHGYNMDGIGRYDSEKDILVVLDDFISSGDTIKRIVKDIQDSLSSPYHLNALCVSTPLGEGMHYYNTQEINRIIEMFDVVICNKYIKQGT